MTAPIPEIVVVGLGPGDAGLLTTEARELLASGPVLLRTRIHPTVDALPEARDWPSFDHLYEGAESFEDLYDAITRSLLREAERGPLVYAVPGHPTIGEATVARLLREAAGGQVRVRIRPAVSFLDVVVAELGIDPVAQNLQIVDALELAASLEREPFTGGSLPLSPLRPAVIAQVYAPAVVSAAKLALLRLYPADAPATLVTAAGTGESRVEHVVLGEIDHLRVNHLATLYLPALDPLAGGRTADSPRRIVARLRAPGGCPWDREQTHRSLTRHLIEEAYEVLDAIERDDPAGMQEELGDLLLQIYLHAQIAEESEAFTLEDVFHSLTSKLVRRHPHVFGETLAETAGEVVANWDQIKGRERAGKGQTAAEEPLGRLPVALPALARAQTVLRRAERRRLLGDTLRELRASAERFAASDPATAQRQLPELVAAIAWAANQAGADLEEIVRRWTLTIEDQARDEISRASTGATVDT